MRMSWRRSESSCRAHLVVSPFAHRPRRAQKSMRRISGRGHASSESSEDSEFGGRRRAAKVRERFADESEETRGILHHWKLEDEKRKEIQYNRGVEHLTRAPLARVEEAK